jgi:hypothetical protein
MEITISRFLGDGAGRSVIDGYVEQLAQAHRTTADARLPI